MIGGKYNKWIFILQEFDLEFVSAKSKKSLIFAELISDFPTKEEEEFIRIHLSKIISSLSQLWIHGMGIISYIYKH